jgi:hypothetical protein
MDSERFPVTGDDAGEPSAGSTGDPRVDEAVAGLAALGDRPLEEHPPALEAVHDKLREVLGELGEPGRPGSLGLQGELGGQRGPGAQGGPGGENGSSGYGGPPAGQGGPGGSR